MSETKIPSNWINKNDGISLATEYIVNNYNVIPQNKNLILPNIKREYMQEVYDFVVSTFSDVAIIFGQRYNTSDDEPVIYKAIQYIAGDGYFITFDGQCVSDITSLVDIDYKADVIIDIFAKDLETIDLLDFSKVIELSEKSKAETDTGIATMHIIESSEIGFSLRSHKLKNQDLNISSHYNDDFSGIHDIIVDHINAGGKGLILLHGLAGTGKTSYIRYLTTLSKRKFIFVPPNMSNILSDPSFISFLSNNKIKNSVLIIEDAENILHKRVAGASQSMANLLNITDGLLSDILNITVICTFNSPLSEIDDALQRKGRLTTRYEFGDLDVNKVNALSTQLGFGNLDEPMVLTDVLNYESTSYKKSITKIGFQ